MKYFYFWVVTILFFLKATFFCLTVEAQQSVAGDPFAETLAGDPFVENLSLQQESPKEPEQRVLDFLKKGWIESRNQFRLRDGRAISARQRLWIETGSSFSFWSNDKKDKAALSSARFFLSGSVDSDMAAASLSDDHSDFTAAIHEAYITFEGTITDVIIGQKMVRWGTGDGINPLDLINPLDHLDPLASGRGDNRLPVLLGQAVFSLLCPNWIQEMTLEAVIVPLAKVNTLPGKGSAWEPPPLEKMRLSSEQGIFYLEGQDKPASWFEDGKYGLRFAATFDGWDLGIAGYTGMKNNPVFSGKIQDDGSIIITPKHPRINALGVSFAKGLNRSTIRGELAVKPSFPLQKTSAFLPDYTRTTMIEFVIGFDRTFSLNRYVNLQYFFTCIPHSSKTINKKWEDGITFELSDLFFSDDLKLGISGIAGFSSQGISIQPYAEYKLGDHWLINASVFLFGGSDKGTYGQFDRRDFACLRLRWSF